jgi:creatinine amidohydrolase
MIMIQLPGAVRTHQQPRSELAHKANWRADDRRHLLTTGIRQYTATGVIGRPSLASADKGRAVLHSLAGNFARVLDLLDGRTAAP